MAVRAIARAERRRAETLRAVAQAYIAEADAALDSFSADLLRQYGYHAESLAAVLEAEAKTNDHEAARVELHPTIRRADWSKSRVEHGLTHGEGRPPAKV